MQLIQRINGRAAHELRAISLTYDVFGYADSSVLFAQGNTKVLCAVTLQQGIPPFLKGKKVGWLTAEYAMLPTSTQTRTQREINTLKRNGRNVEISRLISRTLRAVVQLDVIGEKTITIDCDVLQADGGTRAACITAAFLALKRAVERWISAGTIKETILTDEVAAVSVGASGGNVLLDLDCAEDNIIDADFNFVLTKSGRIIELQGSVEKNTISWSEFESMKTLAVQGVEQIFMHSTSQSTSPTVQVENKEKLLTEGSSRPAGLFSLQNRLK